MILKRCQILPLSRGVNLAFDDDLFIILLVDRLMFILAAPANACWVDWPLDLFRAPFLDI